MTGDLSSQKKTRAKAPRKRAANGRKARGIALRKHLQHLRVAELRDVMTFWNGNEQVNGTKRELVDDLERLMSEEGTVYRRVRTLTRKVLDVLLLLLRRDSYASDLPGLFQRLPGEEAVELEFHEAEAGLKALFRRGFLAEVADKSMAANGNGRVVYTVPDELGETLTSLFREETRTIGSVMSLGQHAAAITATERAKLQDRFPGLGGAAGPEDAQAILGTDGAPALLEFLEDEQRKVAEFAMARHAGFITRTDWSRRRVLKDLSWDRKGWSQAFEGAGVGTVARLSLSQYGIACDDDALVVFDEVLEDWLQQTAPEDLGGAEILRPGCDLVADLCAFLEHVRRNPVRVSRTGEVYKAGRRKIQDGFIFRESFLAGKPEIWSEVYGAAEHLTLIGTDDEGFLELQPEAERFLLLPLEEKVRELYRLAIEQAGPRGRSLHQHELRKLVADVLREQPERWFFERSLATLCRHRYLATLDELGIEDRHRDRFFSAYFSGRETPADLLDELDSHWLRRMYMLGFLEAAVKDDTIVAWRLSPVGARVLGAEVSDLDTGLQPMLVNPDFEILVLPEGDVSDVIHTLDGYAQRVKTEDVVHFRLTKESIEAAVGAGRSVKDFTAFLEARSRGDVPQNVIYSIKSWAGAVTFATLEKGVVLKTEDEVALERILQFPEMQALVIRRLGEGEVLLKAAPTDRKLLASMRERGIEVQGP
ncbi:MAG: helicase-associated domain-containing protein [Planctomycetota bacterium]|nr:helicase-associated domain-containing protein [Planctomycetota bacterium]